MFCWFIIWNEFSNLYELCVKIWQNTRLNPTLEAKFVNEFYNLTDAHQILKIAKSITLECSFW